MVAEMVTEVTSPNLFLQRRGAHTISIHAFPLWGFAKWCSTLATSWTVVRQAPLSMGFSRQEYWSGLPFPPLGDLPDPRSNPGIEHKSPALQADSLPTVPP